ncbi:MAG: bifunctional diaminohydroxyphosphoribosylaminopyrimidine deaminase/5-amino-6-(5-phosphoribosylamino)uracil reductase RibD, partial [Acidimicrobiia bacterium]
MAMALDLGEQGRRSAPPNPWVGCVVERDGQVVGTGFHRAPGEPHAEPVALAEAGERARGATAWVTLEPCNHHGRTPPCTDGLIAAGVARV